MTDPLYRQVFPKVEMKTASSTASRPQRAARSSLSGAAPPSPGAAPRSCLIDDPIKDRVEADSPVTREKLWSGSTRSPRPGCCPTPAGS